MPKTSHTPEGDDCFIAWRGVGSFWIYCNWIWSSERGVGGGVVIFSNFMRYVQNI